MITPAEIQRALEIEEALKKLREEQCPTLRERPRLEVPRGDERHIPRQ